MSQYDWISSIAAGSGVDTITIDANTMAGSPYILTGTTGVTLTTNGSGLNWGDTISASQDLFPNTLDVKGDANFSGDLTIKGVSLTDTLSKIEERLAILRPNEVLEERWEKLKELGKQYRELEKEILEKEQVWKILKK